MKAGLKPIVAVMFVAAVFASITSTSASDREKRGAKASSSVTFFKDVAPIFYSKCADCHRPGEAAPFSVLSYRDVRPWAKSIKEKVLNREMPPWHADPHVGRWANDRRLSQEEIDTITAWVDQGAAEGNQPPASQPPSYSEGWLIGKPDLIIEMPEEYTVAAEGPDEYQYFDVPTNFTEDRYVQMAEARPGDRKVVHHIIAFAVPPGTPTLNKMPKEMRDKAVEMSLANTPFYRDGFLIRMREGQPVYDEASAVPEKLRGFNNVDDFLTAYAPGSNYGVWAPGTVKRIPAGAIIRFQIHYSKVAGETRKDRSMVGFVFAKQPPANMLRTRAVANMFFQIPPQSPNHRVTASWSPRNDITIYSLMPHMHYRGKAMEIRVVYPDGRAEALLHVPNYSFAWQTSYFPVKPIRIPGGSKIEVTGYFDNTAKNKFNPDPTKAVRYGEPTYDEMMMGFLDYVVEKPATRVKVRPEVFSAYVGRYQMGPNRFYEVTREGDRFFGQATENPKRELFAISEDRFSIPEVDSQIQFIKGQNGEIVEMLYEQNERSTRCKRIKEGDATQK
jgi:hypothetical protein